MSALEPDDGADTRMREIAVKYEGREVAIQTYGMCRYEGRLVYCDSEFLVLSDARLLSEYDTSYWQEAMLDDDVAPVAGDASSHTVISYHQIVAITCRDSRQDDWVRPPESAEDEAEAASNQEVDHREMEMIPAGVIPASRRLVLLTGNRLAEYLHQGEPALVEIVLDRIRKALLEYSGFSIPEFEVIENAELHTDGYALMVGGVPVAQGKLREGHYSVAQLLDERGRFRGLPAREARNELPVLRHEPAELATLSQDERHAVVGAAQLLTYHLTEALRHVLPQLLTRQIVYRSLERLYESAPDLAKNFASPESRTRLHQVLKLVLAARYHIGDFELIAEEVAAVAVEKRGVDDIFRALRIRAALPLSRRALTANGEVAVVAPSQTLLSRFYSGDEAERHGWVQKYCLYAGKRENFGGKLDGPWLILLNDFAVNVNFMHLHGLVDPEAALYFGPIEEVASLIESYAEVTPADLGLEDVQAPRSVKTAASSSQSSKAAGPINPGGEPPRQPR